MAEHIIVWIILQLKASKNTDFIAEHIIEYVALLFTASKNDLKLAKCRFYDEVFYTMQYIVIKDKQIFRFGDGAFYTMHRIAN